MALPSQSGEVVSPTWPPHSLWLAGVSEGGSQGTGLELQTSFTGTWSCDKKMLFTAQAVPIEIKIKG